MTIEEKAKAYDEAKTRMSIAYNSNRCTIGFMNEIFPELKESEEEKIKKRILLSLQKDIMTTKNSGCNTKDLEKCIAWLEKQGEQKQEINNFDVLPGLYKCVHRMFDGTPDGRLLFEVGNVYKCLSKHDRAEFEVSYGHSVYLEDPVVCKHFIPFEKQDEQKPFDYENADIQQKDFAPKETVKEAESNLTPLERKVKDILFSFHINAADGISFDGTMAIVHNLITLCQQEQKPADKIKPKFKVGDKVIGIVSDMQYYITDVCYDHYYTESGCIIMFCSQDNFKLVEQKPAWSEEDECYMAECINAIATKEGWSFEEKRKTKHWLKSLKPQNRWKPSDEQMEALESATENCAYSEYQDCLRELIGQLKKLKER